VELKSDLRYRWRFQILIRVGEGVSRMSNEPGRAALIAVILILLLALAAGNLALYLAAIGSLEAGAGAADVLAALKAAYLDRPLPVLYFGAAPLVVGLALVSAVALRRDGGAAAPRSNEKEEGPAADPAASALRLLALLQSEGRLIDFLEEDIDAYDDAQVGAAVRSIHAGCRKALHERMRIERVYADEDGATVEVAADFDRGAVRLTGNVHGQPPFRGVLQHGGWRASDVRLPDSGAGIDPATLAPAEVEIS
jgi:hypothetical protein